MLVILVVSVGASTLRASQAQLHSFEGYASLSKGDLEDAALTGAGDITLGYGLAKVADALPGPVLALAPGEDGAVYAATANPARIWRVRKGEKPKLVAELKKPLITALLIQRPGELVALTAPSGAAEFIDAASGAVKRRVEYKAARAVLGASVLGTTIYAVGGGDEGVLLRLQPGATAFETLAVVKESYLRTITARATRSGPQIVVGGANEGIVYAWTGERLRALVDAEPSEVTALAISARGEIFAALVDADGKLSEGATERDRDGEAPAPKTKPRKVKSAEVWRISPDGRSEVLFQSKAYGAYALALAERGRKLYVGAGAKGRVYAIDPAGKLAASVVASTQEHEEIVALLADGAGGLWAGTAHGGAVLHMDRARVRQAAFSTPPLDAGALARFGMVHVQKRLPEGTSVTVQLRTGNTKTPDDTWSAFSPALTADGVPAAPAGRYAQLRLVLSRTKENSPLVSGASLAYLVDNRAPELSRIDVLTPGWKVTSQQREPNDARSVTFSKEPFKKFVGPVSGVLPELSERPSGKQVAEAGYQTVYAWAEDPDQDALRYQFYLGKVSEGGEIERWQLVKPWSTEPFLSYDASRSADGAYRVRVEVDDLLTNGPIRVRSDELQSNVFTVSHRPPSLSDVATRALEGGVRLRFRATATLPLVAIRCAVNGGEWVPIDPADGMVDGREERVDVLLPAVSAADAISCEAVDQALNMVRVDVKSAS